MNKIFAILTVVFVVLPLGAIDVQPTAPYYVGDSIQFRASAYDFQYYPAVWTFGDGTTLSSSSGSTWVTHIYYNPGTYVVRVSNPLNYIAPEQMTVVVGDDRSISVSPAAPREGETLQAIAVNFKTPNSIRWNMGDGTIYTSGGSAVSHTYDLPGAYTVRAWDWNGNTAYNPVTRVINVGALNRKIVFGPAAPRADQQVSFQAENFRNGLVDWDFGDGTLLVNQGKLVMHRFAQPGTYTVRARESGRQHAPVTVVVTVLPDIRFIEAVPRTVYLNETVVFLARHFYGNLVLWNFGDSTTLSAPVQVTHKYQRPGIFQVTARDENGVSTRVFSTTVEVRGITDEVELKFGELRFNNGKFYRVVARNSRDIQGVMQLRFKGTGLVNGSWILDGQVFELFSEMAYEGRINEIRTRKIPGLPTLQPGLHTLTARFSRPVTDIRIPEIRYFVLPYEAKIELISPPPGFLAAADKAPLFTWKKARGSSYYEIAFSDSATTLVNQTDTMEWQRSEGSKARFAVPVETWSTFSKDALTYWQVKGVDGSGNTVALSSVGEFRIIETGGLITVETVTALDGKEMTFAQKMNISVPGIILRGSFAYPGKADSMVLRVLNNDRTVNRLIYKNVRPGTAYPFETSVLAKPGKNRIRMQLLFNAAKALPVGETNFTVNRK